MKLYHKDATSCSWGGETFEAQDGAFEVPEQAAADLLAHGFTTVAPEGEPAPAAPPSGNPAQWKKEVLTAEAVRLGVNPELPRAEILAAVAGARKAEADAVAVSARITELEAKEQDLTDDEAKELAALKGEE